MTAFGILNFLAALLELCVPSYALRLVRRFGARQAGGFVVIAFSSLALIHLVNPVKAWPNSNLALSLLYMGASVLLLIGMGHTETVCLQRQQAQLDEQSLRLKLDAEAKERSEDLVKIKQEMAQEIVRLQQQLETLSVSERQHRLLFTQSPHVMWIFDLRTGRILAGNLAALSQYGFSQKEFTNLLSKDLLPREAVEAFQADAAKPCSSLESRGVWRHRRKDRTTIDVEIKAMDLRFGDCPARLIFAEDICPRISHETELCERERMRVLRRVAEGVAHHFGHILGVVEGQTGLLQDREESTADTEHLTQVLSETRRGTALVRQLQTAGACEPIQAEPVDLNQFIQQKEPLLHRLIWEQITLQLHLGEGLPPALADPRAIERILVNLVLNARDALPQGGVIDIHTEATWVDAHQNSNHFPARSRPGHYVHLTVRDNGCGMTPEVQEHLFEPFFTTRSDGKAMGLGLATIYGAVKQLGGWVECISQERRGTEFNVFLPAAPLKSASAVVAEQAIAPATRETILLIDSNDRVRDLARHILQRNGYRVIEADCPATATMLLETQAKNIHLLLTDLNFPNGASGHELAEQIRQINPSIKVVYASGQLSPDDTEPAILQEARLLLKPYTPERLLQAITAGLSNNQSSALD